MFVLDALVAGQSGGIGVVARGVLEGAATRDDVLALVPPGVTPPVPHTVVGGTHRRAVRLALQRSGLLLAAGGGHVLRGGARFVALDAFSTPVALPRSSRAIVHDTLPFTHPTYWGTVDRWHKTTSCRTAFRRAEVLVVSSAHNARLVQHLSGRDPVVAPFGCGQLRDDEADRWLATGPTTSRTDRIVTVGTIQPRKRLDLLLRAFDRARRAGLDGIELVVVGDGLPHHVQPVRRLASDLDVPVTWAGRLPRADLVSMIATSRAVVYASQDEGFGLPLLEAMAVGTRPVAADVPEMRSWASTWPRWFDVTAPEASLAEALVDAATGADDWDAAGAMHAVASHRWRSFVDRLLAPP